VSKFYRYGIEVEVLTYSPVDQVRRPKAGAETTSIGLSPGELTSLLGAAEQHSPRWSALFTLLAYNGLRIDEALAGDVADYTYQRGHRVLRITRKGGTASTQPLAAPTVRALDAYLSDTQHPRGRPAVSRSDVLEPAPLPNRDRPAAAPCPHGRHTGR